MKLTNIKTGKRLAMGFGLLSVFMLSISGLAWWGLTSLNRISAEVSQGSLQIQGSSTELSTLSEQLQQRVRRFKV